MKNSRVFRYAFALLVIALAGAAYRWDPGAPREVPVASYAILLQIDATAPDGAQMELNVKGDTTDYAVEGLLKSVCVPIVPDSAGTTARLIVGINGEPVITSFIIFFPGPQLPQVNVIADSSGVHVRRSPVLTCQP